MQVYLSICYALLALRDLKQLTCSQLLAGFFFSMKIYLMKFLNSSISNLRYTLKAKRRFCRNWWATRIFWCWNVLNSEPVTLRSSAAERLLLVWSSLQEFEATYIPCVLCCTVSDRGYLTGCHVPRGGQLLTQCVAMVTEISLACGKRVWPAFRRLRQKA